jgi:hypothetical protein
MKKTFVLGGMAAAVVLLSAACVIPVYISDYGQYTTRGVFHRTIALDSGGTILIENDAGDIEIQGWDKDEVEITAEEDLGGRYGWRVGPYGRSVAGPKVDVDKMEDFLTIKARIPERERDIRRVYFTLNVPHSVNLKDVRNELGDIRIVDIYGKVRVNLEEGIIKVENFSGSLDLSLVRGSVEAELLDVRKDDNVRITTREGDITLYLQPDVNVKIEAATGNGGISSDFDLGLPLPSKKVSARLGSLEEAVVSLSALIGNIRLKKIA